MYLLCLLFTRRRWQDTPAKTKSKREEAPKLPPEVAEDPTPPTEPTDPTDTTHPADTTPPTDSADTTPPTDAADTTPPTLHKHKAPTSPKKRAISAPLYEDDSSDSVGSSCWFDSTSVFYKGTLHVMFF